MAVRLCRLASVTAEACSPVPYDGTVLGRQPLGIEVDRQAGTGVLYNALGPGGGPLADGQGARLSYDAATGALTSADGTVVGRYADGRMTPAQGVDLPALIHGAPLIVAPPSPLGDGVLADPILPPLPTFPPPLVPPQIDNQPEALVPPPSPSQTSNEGFTPTPLMPGDFSGMPIDGPQLPIILESNAYMPAANGKVYDTSLKTWIDQATGQVSSPPVLGVDVQSVGAQFSGSTFPTTPQPPNTIMYRLDSAGNITSYQVWADDGLPAYRVDLQGSSHGGMPPPHTLYYPRNPAPSGQVFANTPTRAIKSLLTKTP